MTSLADQVSRTARSPAFKFFLICLLILMLLVPLLLVMGLVSEREGRAQSVRAEVASFWGGPQHLAGPFLVVPYTVRHETMQGDKSVTQILERRAVFVPEDLSVKGKADTQVLHRAIFDVNVYTSDLVLEGRFLAPSLAEVEPDAIAVRWRDATLVLGISDVSGLKEAASVEIGEGGRDKVPFRPSLGIPGADGTGIHARLDAAPSALASADASPLPFPFRIALKFTGSSSLMIAPAARETRLALSSSWPHPSFSGAFLPAERKVGDGGFEATWRVPHLARSVPNAWSLNEASLERFRPFSFGVSFYQPVDHYDLVSRAVKYGILFLAMGFMGVFVLELFSARRVHPVQYLFVGLAMVFFYVILLSLAEHIGFSWAYIAALLATGGMLSVYVGKALRSTVRGLVMMALFVVLYGFLYLILTLEDYALLAGAILGFAALTAVMFTTLDLDWSQGEPARSTPDRN